MDIPKLPRQRGLLSIQGDDGIELQGYLADGASDRLLLHFHGLAGNFYENQFVHTFADAAPRRGWSFLSANTRAHDYFSEAHFAKSTETLRRGAAHTKMAEVCADLGAWLHFASVAGFTKIVMQGHSAGAVAVARYLLGPISRGRVWAAVFASPTDMIGLQLDSHGQRFNDFLNLATQRVGLGQGSSLMPEDTLDGYRFDAATYLDLFKPGGPADIFDFRSPEKLRDLETLRVPCLFFFGGGQEVCSVPVTEALTALEMQIGAQTPVATRLVNGAPHSYRGYESQVFSTVFDWIAQLEIQNEHARH